MNKKIKMTEKVLFWGCPLLLILALVFGGLPFWPEILSQYRFVFLLFLAPALLLSYFYYKVPNEIPFIDEKKEKKYFWILTIFYLLTFIKVSITSYLAFRVAGIDFSVLDQMIPYTALGKFMLHPVLEVNHFGIHSTSIYFLLYPFHRLFNSPYFFLILHPVMLWCGAFPLYSLMKHFWKEKSEKNPHAGWLRLIFLLAYFNFYQLSQVLKYNFHFEVFYIPFFLYLFLFMEKRRYLLAAVMTVLLLSIKEDAGLYLVFTSIAYGVYFRRGLPAIILGLFSLAIFILNTQFILPRYRESDIVIVQMINKYGQSYGEIIKNFIFHPFLVFIDVIKGGWLKILIPFLFTPLISPFFLISMAGLILITSTASYLDIRTLAIHYSSPYLPYVFFGAILGLKKLPSKVIVAASLFVLVFGGGFLTFPKINFGRISNFNKITQNITYKEGEKICIQGILMPHFNYENLLQKKFLTDECIDHREKYYLFNPELDTYPHSKENIIEMIRTLEVIDNYKKITEGDFVLLTK